MISRRGFLFGALALFAVPFAPKPAASWWRTGNTLYVQPGAYIEGRRFIGLTRIVWLGQPGDRQSVITRCYFQNYYGERAHLSIEQPFAVGSRWYETS